MKRTFAFALILALLLSLSVPALAFTVVASSQALSVNGQAVECEKYNIDNKNYFKLRDIAYLLNGTGSQFDIGWDAEKGVASITTGQPYTSPNGTELVVGADQSATAKVSTQTIMINGVVRDDLTVYNIGDNNFFQLREMGDALGFDVGYDEATRTMLVVSWEAPQPTEEPQPAEEPEPESETAFDFLVNVAKEKGSADADGNYQYNFKNATIGEKQNVDQEFWIAYLTKEDTLKLMLNVHQDRDTDKQLDIYAEIYITRGLTSPYTVTYRSDFQGQFACEGTIRLLPELINMSRSSLTPFYEYKGSPGIRESYEKNAAAQIRASIVQTVVDLMIPNGYTYKDLGFIIFNEKIDNIASTPEPGYMPAPTETPKPTEAPKPTTEPEPEEDVATRMRKRALEEMERYYSYLSIDKDILDTKVELYRLAGRYEKAAAILEIQNQVKTMWDEAQSIKRIMDEYSDYLDYLPLKLAFKYLEYPLYTGSDSSYISDVNSFNRNILTLLVAYEGASDLYLGTNLLKS